MSSTAFNEGVRRARIRVTVQRPEWGGAARIGGEEWRQAAWDGLPADRLQQVVYLPGAFANFAPAAPAALLAAAAAHDLPLTVTVLDLPEFRASRLPPGWAGRLARATTLADDAELLRAALEQIVPGRYTVVGWSTGAYLATILAALAPERVAALQLCMPAGFYTQPVLTRLTPNFLRNAVTSLRDPRCRQAALESRHLDVTVELVGSLGKLAAIVQMVRLLGQGSAVGHAAQVRCPVVFVLGQADVIFAPLIAMHARGELAALFPQAPTVTVHVLEQVTHNGFVTHPDEIAAITLATLCGREPARG